MSEELSLKNDEKHENFEGLESTMPAQKVAYTMPETMISFVRFRAILQVSNPSLAIAEGQATAITA